MVYTHIGRRSDEHSNATVPESALSPEGRVFAGIPVIF